MRSRCPRPAVHSGTLRVLDEWGAKQWLSRAGVSVPDGRSVPPGEAIEAAGEIGFPVAMKIVDAGLLHKTEAGAVALGLRDRDEVAGALARFDGAHSVSRILVEPMIDDVVAELIVGVRYDEGFGHALVIGAGGVLVELLTDSVTILLPATRDVVADGLGKLRVSRLLAGFRGNPPGDGEALIDAILAVATLAMEERDRLVEVDVNPLMVFEGRPGGRRGGCAGACSRMILTLGPRLEIQTLGQDDVGRSAPELDPPDLPRNRFWQPVDKLDLARILIRRRVLLDEILNLLREGFVTVLSGRQHHKRFHNFPTQLIRAWRPPLTRPPLDAPATRSRPRTG